MTKRHDLKEMRASKIAEARSIIEAAESGSRDLSGEERARFDGLKTEITGLEERIARAETIAAMERAEAADPLTRSGAPDIRNYSVARALRCAASGRIDGVEGEFHQELSRGRELRGNIMLPTEVLLGSERRATQQQVVDNTTGGFLVATNLAAAADRFRPALKVESLGATVLRNLVGFLDLPKLTGSGSTAWIGEGENTTRTKATFGTATLSAKTVSGEYSMSRQIMKQANESIETLLRRDLGLILATAIDASAIKKRGTSTSEPMGVLDSGLVKTATATLLQDTAADCIAALEVDDVSGSAAFFTNPTVMQAARKVKATTNEVIPVSAVFHDQRVESSTQVPNNIGSGSNKSALIFGAWEHLIVGYWSGVDILVNPYHQDVASQGGALLHAFLDCDVAVRHVEAFTYAEI